MHICRSILDLYFDRFLPVFCPSLNGMGKIRDRAVSIWLNCGEVPPLRLRCDGRTNLLLEASVVSLFATNPSLELSGTGNSACAHWPRFWDCYSDFSFLFYFFNRCEPSTQVGSSLPKCRALWAPEVFTCCRQGFFRTLNTISRQQTKWTHTACVTKKSISPKGWETVSAPASSPKLSPAPKQEKDSTRRDDQMGASLDCVSELSNLKAARRTFLYHCIKLRCPNESMKNYREAFTVCKIS